MRIIFLLLLIVSGFISPAQPPLEVRIDSLIHVQNDTMPFNGTVVVFQGSQFICNLNSTSTLVAKSQSIAPSGEQQYVIGSISKQFTAAIILQLYDKGKLQLHVPIRRYLPELTIGWADSVTIHHLLTHTHGIVELDQPLAFTAGSRFQYSQIGYALLSDIIENVTGKSFAMVSARLFYSCKMKYTMHPSLHKHKQLVKGYAKNENGELVEANNSFENYVAAGGFISTAQDLVKWNICLHNGQILSEGSYKLMITPYATREHPIFGPTQYGYGITVGTPDRLTQLGQTGYAPGFVSMNFYFPKSYTSVIVLENVDWDPENIKNSFTYHTQILYFVREQLHGK